MYTSSVQGSPKGTNQDKAGGSVHHETSPTLKEHTQNVNNIMNVDIDTKLVGSNEMSGTLTTVTKMNARYVGSVSCITFTARGYTQKISIWGKCNCEQLLSHKTCIKMPCHWNCVFWGFKVNTMVITPHCFIWLPFCYLPFSYKMFLIEAPLFSNLYYYMTKIPYLSDTHGHHANIMVKESGQVKKQ